MPHDEDPVVPNQPAVPEMNNPPEVTIVGKKGKSKDYWVIRPGDREIVRVHLRPRSERFTPCQVHCPVLSEDLSHQRTTRWKIVGSDNPTQCIHDSWTDPSEAHALVDVPPGRYWIGETVFTLSPQASLPSGTDDEVLLTQWTSRQARQVTQHVKKLERVKGIVFWYNFKDMPFLLIY